MTLINFLAAIFLACWGLYLYRTNLEWKRELKLFEKELNLQRNSNLANYLAEETINRIWEKDLSHREKVWNDLKVKIEKDSKWKLKN